MILQNIMFKSKEPMAPLRLIDFGSGCISSVPNPKKKKDEGRKTLKLKDGTEAERYTTFAGSAFYMSPEMYQFQQNVTGSKTGKWYTNHINLNCMYIVQCL